VIVINVDVMLARRKMTVTELAERLGFTLANVSMLKTGKIKALKMTTLDKLCEALDCQPGDILEYRRAAVAAGGGDGETAGGDEATGSGDGGDGDE
jgi:putative transcriptional regulator